MKTYYLIIALATLLASSAAADARIEKDVRYADRSDRNVLDIYLPEGVKNPPLVVWIHGGAFKMGDNNNPVGLRAFLDAGFAVASIDYRLSNEWL
jgi:carboxylesterase type B